LLPALSGAYPDGFSPDLYPRAIGRIVLSVGVLRRQALARRRPSLLFRMAAFQLNELGEQSGSSSGALASDGLPRTLRV
jgi:hypothetical protein